VFPWPTATNETKPERHSNSTVVGPGFGRVVGPAGSRSGRRSPRSRAQTDTLGRLLSAARVHLIADAGHLLPLIALRQILEPLLGDEPS
jgi:hypothetical protein